MNSFYPEKNACDQEMRMASLVCPKPRRYNSSITPPFSLQSEMEDSGAGADLLDIILPKGSCYQGSQQVVASPPPFWCGSPPTRASNPVIQDEQFGNGNFSPFTEPSSSSARGCAPMKFGGTPATVRIEGFDCLRRNRSSHSISAVA